MKGNEERLQQDYIKAWKQALAIMKSEGYSLSSKELKKFPIPVPERGKQYNKRRR